MGEQAVKDFIVDEAVDHIDPFVDSQEDQKDIERVLWESVSLEVNVEASNGEIHPHAIWGEIEGAGSIGEVQSIKPTNIQFNVEELAAAVASSMCAVASAISNPILVPAAVLCIALSAKQTVTVDLTTEEVVVFTVIHEHSDSRGIPKSEIEAQVESFVNRQNLQITIDNIEIERALAKLEYIDSIEIVEEFTDENRFRSCEQYRVAWG